MTEDMFVLKIGEIPQGKVAINPTDCEGIGLDDKNLCQITFPTTMQEVVAEVIKESSVEIGHFVVNKDLAFQLEIEEGFECTLNKFNKPIKNIDGVTLRIDTLGSKPMDIGRYITDEKDKVIEFMKGKLIRKGSTLISQDMGVTVEVYDTVPKLSPDEIAIFEDVENVKISQKYTSTFNGILLIDASSSMVSEEEDDMMDPMTNEEFLQNISRVDESIKRYIDTYIREKNKIRRFDSAILAALAFLNTKVAKGRGEKISIVLYSDDATPINLVIDGEKRPWISAAGGELMGRSNVSEILTTELINRALSLDSAQTDIEKALVCAKEIADAMEEHEKNDGKTPKDIHGKPISNPTMIILLTDGRRTVGRAPVTVVKELFANRPKTILHTIGLGGGVAEDELFEIARLCHGKYFNTTNAQALLKFYDKEATDFASIKGKSEFDAIFDRLKSLKS